MWPQYHVWAVGAAGTILHTANTGKTWVAQGSGTGVALRAVDFVDAKAGWAVGDAGTILATVDGGTTWKAQSSGTTTDLFGVSFVDASTGWVVGSGGRILFTRNGGATWSPQTSGTTSDLRGVSFADAQHGCAAGFLYGNVLVTSDGGADWSQKPTGAFYLFDVSFVDASHVWAVGGLGAVVASSDGGANWTAQSSGTNANLRGVAFMDKDRGLIAGAGSYVAPSYRASLLASTSGGASWAAVTNLSSPSMVNYNDVAFAGTQYAWAVGDGGLIEGTDSAGNLSIWSTDISGTAADLYGVSAVAQQAPITATRTRAVAAKKPRARPTT